MFSIKNSQKGSSILVALLIISVVVFLFGIFYYKKENSSNLADQQVQSMSMSDSQQREKFQSAANALFGKTYADAKRELAAKGWIAYEPDANDPSLGEPWVSAGDSTYPEIGWCGQGLDAICNVNFKKGNIEEHLIVKIGGRAPIGPYKEWTVMGHE